LKDYGFVEKTVSGGFRVSKLAIDAQYGTSKEKKDSLIKALNNIPLWTQFFENFQVRVPEDPKWLK